MSDLEPKICSASIIKSRRSDISVAKLLKYKPTLLITARHTEYDEGYVFSLSVHRRDPCNFSTRCPTDLASLPVVQIFATRCPTYPGGVPKTFFSVSLPVPLPMGGGGPNFFSVSLPVPLLTEASQLFFYRCHF